MTTLVGRDDEVRELARMLREARRAVVVGEAGIGKTALVTAATENEAVWAGGAFATLSWVPFLPIARALRSDLAGASVDEVAERVVSTADSGVLFLDDLHAADPGTLGVLDVLPPQTRVVATVRTGEPGTGRALDALTSSGFEPLRLAELDRDAAAALARARGADSALMGVLLDRASGNPLLIEELARGGGASPTLEATLRVRLDALDAAARRDFELLAVAGRPLSRSLVLHADALEDASLIVGGAEIAPRHALLAEVAAEALDDTTRRTLHERLAEMLDDDGERARHLSAAGRVEEARGAALRAARIAASVAERADHLALAASCSDGIDADALRLEAAQALYDVGRLEAARDVLAHVIGSASPTRAHVNLLSSLVESALGNAERAQRAVSEGLIQVRGTGSPIEVRLLTTAADHAMFIDGDATAAVESAHEAAALAERTGHERPRAYSGLASALLFANRPRADWEPWFRAAMELARGNDIVREIVAANNYAIGLEQEGAWDEMSRLVAEISPRARAAGAHERLRCLENSLRHRLTAVGEYDAYIERAQTALSGPLESENRLFVEVGLALALIDVGRFVGARDVIARIERIPGRSDWTGSRLWLEAELLYWSGRTRDAADYAAQALRDLSTGPQPDVPAISVVAFQAALDLGTPLPAVATSEYFETRMHAAANETHALDAFGRRAPNAVALLEACVAEWARIEIRGELRCAWRLGEALRHAGNDARAREVLEAAERRADTAGMRPLTARIRQALRGLGVMRSAARRSAGELTAREHEILDRVAEGMSNEEIAAQLGIAPRTVKGAIAAASRKLGATTRAQAAVLAARE